MYKLHLILKYLRKRRIAWVSLIAVTLCTAMVLVVISVMGGWLRMFLDTTRALDGDVIISRRSAEGFSHYEEILSAVRKLPEVEAACSVITTFGVANFSNQFQSAVQVKAFGDLDQVGPVNSFKKGLYRQYIQPHQQIEDDSSLSRAEKDRREAELAARPPSFEKPLDAKVYREYLPGKNFDSSALPGMIVGTHFLHRNKDGSYERGSFIYRDFVKLSVGDIRTVDSGTPSVTPRTYWIVDDCRTKFYPVDANTVYVPFEKLQSDLGMASVTVQEKIGDKVVEQTEPARVNEIQIALKPGIDLYQGRDAVRKAVDEVQGEFPIFSGVSDPLTVESWDQRQAQYTSAIIHEKVLLTFLFGMISIVAVFLVFCIFYMIVAEKTRDIGIIKSLGASNGGVAQIFLGYGLFIGVLGGGMGLLTAYLIVHNINPLHAWLGRAMGIVIWSPETYIFDTIPNTMQFQDTAWIVSVAVLSALAGALVPAIAASRMHPVEALRWE